MFSQATATEPSTSAAAQGTNTELHARVVSLEAMVQALLDTNEQLLNVVAELQTPTVANAKRTVAAGTGSQAPRIGNGVFGYSCTSILRFLGSVGFTNKQCMAVISHYQPSVSPATVQTQRQCGRKGVGSLPALTGPQVAELYALAGIPVANVVDVELV